MSINDSLHKISARYGQGMSGQKLLLMPSRWRHGHGLSSSVLSISLSCLFFFLSASPLQATQNTPVFVLHSYSQEYPWTKREHEGFMRKLAAALPGSLTVCVEYLDTKRVSYTAGYADRVAEHLAQKYAEFQPKAIYVTDDNALLFALSHLPRIFPDVPVFFAGVNDYQVKAKLPSDRVTGVFERKYIHPNLELMDYIDSEARDILLVGDESETFKAIRQEIVTELEEHPKIQAHFLSGNRIDSLVEALHGRPERFVFLTTLGKMTDAAGRTLTLPETISAIVHAGSFIIISMEDVYLYPGVLGGYVTSGFKQGEAAAGMVLRYLSGTAVSDIPPIETSPNEYIFDSKELSRIGVKLPPEIARLATILNPLPTFYERNLHVIVRTLYALALLFVLSLSIFLYLVLRKNRQITESEEKHRILFEGSPDAYLILAHGVITDCNRATQAMLRGDRKEIIGQTPASLSPELQPDGRKSSEVVDEKIGEVLRTGRQTFDWMNRRLDKTDFWVEVTISLMTMQGLPVLFIALRDITERKHAAAAILQAKNDWEDTFNSINDVITVHDNNFNIILANKAAEKLGWNPARGAKQNVKCFKFFHDTENPPPNCVTCQCLETGCPAVFELYEPRFDKHLEIRAIPRLDSNNRLAGSIHIARDITARKLAEAEIQRLVSAIEQTRETVKIMSPDGAVQYINRAVEQSTGKTRGEIIGKNIFDNELVSDNLREIWRSVSEGRVWSGRLAQELNGIAYEFEFTMTPVFDATGTLTSIISIGRDVTHEKKLEEQLLQSQKMQAIGTLAGGIAHDFNNMLTGIIGFAEIAKDKVAQDSRPVYYLEQILKLSQRAASLVQQILVFSRKAGSIHTPMQLSPLLKEVLTLLRATLPTTIEIRQKLLDQGSLVEADPTQIHQVLMNLCINAAHAMEEQGGALEIELTRVSLSHDDILPGQDIEPGPHVFLKVSDTGTGIDPAIISRIFDPFFTTKDVGRGTGLGLSVVHGIIKDHRGDIAVTSEQGKGTTFLILLPEVSAPAESIRAKDNMEPLSGTEHILFVDDEDALTGLAKELLEPLGYRVTAAQSGQEAWELFQKTPEQFDLVITDLTMPHMTGYELALKLIGFKPGIPVILSTGYNERNRASLEKEQSITAVLTKPFNRRVLTETIRKALISTS